MEKKSKRVFKIIVTSLFTFLSAVIIFESCLDGETSAKQSKFIANTIEKVLLKINPPKKVEVKDIEINNTQTNYPTNYSFKLDYSIFPSEATDHSVSFESSNSNIVSISNDGVVNIKNITSNTEDFFIKVISNSNNDVSKVYNFNVSKYYPTDIRLLLDNYSSVTNESSIELYNSFPCHFDIDFIGNNYVTEKEYSLDYDKDYLSVENGYLTPLKNGKTSINLTTYNLNKQYEVNITENPDKDTVITSLKLDSNELQVNATSKVKIFNNEVEIKQNFVLSSSNLNIISVDSKARTIIAVSAGEATITLYGNNGEILNTKIKVIEHLNKPIVTIPGLNNNLLDLKIYDKVPLFISFPEETTYKSYSVIIDDTSIITLKDNIISAIKDGSTTLRVKLNNENENYTVEINVVVRQSTISNFSKFAFLIRKSIGHLMSFFALGLLAFLTFYLSFGKSYKTLFVILYGFTIAGLSELIQILTPGRYGTIQDVGIDCLGYYAAIVLLSIIFGLELLIKYLKSKKNN